MSNHWDVHVIEYARSKDQPLVDLVNGVPPSLLLDVPFGFVLCQNGERNVLIDTGFLKEGGDTEFSDKFGIPYWISPVRMLEEMGVKADEITDIVLSHAHFDHMGGISAFTKARIFIQKREWLSWNEAMALPRQFSYLTMIVNPDNMRSAFDAAVEHRLVLVDGDKDNILPGIHVRLGEGHTMGQQFIIVETARGRLVAAGDCVYSRANITGHKHDGVYAPLNNAVGSVWKQLETIDRINDEIAGDFSRLIMMHDNDRWAHLPLVKEVEGFRIVKAS
jgi:glyoxylase-like metal-dependent hydrolase (beta-lactamase superfamily II)